MIRKNERQANGHATFRTQIKGLEEVPAFNFSAPALGPVNPAPMYNAHPPAPSIPVASAVKYEEPDKRDSYDFLATDKLSVAYTAVRNVW